MKKTFVIVLAIVLVFTGCTKPAAVQNETVTLQTANPTMENGQIGTEESLKKLDQQVKQTLADPFAVSEPFDTNSVLQFLEDSGSSSQPLVEMDLSDPFAI